LDLARHDRSELRSGEPSLDEWLQRFAGQAARRDGARTYVAVEGSRVIGYYSLCSYQVDRAASPPRTQLGGHPIPAILLARLAVDISAQGWGLGSALLLDALRISALVADRIGARILVVHALHERAAGFYLRHGFTRFDTDPLSLYLRMQDVRATLTDAGLR
jgi:predicted N-acetyltransferase YhbS